MSPSLATVAIAVTLSAIGAAACAEGQPVAPDGQAIVQRVADGDSLVLEGGVRVRLLQTDAPELGAGECYGREALRVLQQLLEPGDEVRLEADPRLDRVDRYQRLLRYVHSEDTNVNVELVRLGAATPFFRRGERGRHADVLLDAIDEARDGRQGMWGACRVLWDSKRQIETRFP